MADIALPPTQYHPSMIKHNWMEYDDTHRRIVKTKAPTPCPPTPKCTHPSNGVHGKTDKRERHWLTWPKTPAPPATPMYPRSATPRAQRTWNPEASLPPRSKSVAYMRPTTPADLHDQCVTPVYDDMPTNGALHHPDWNGSTNLHRAATPLEFNPDYRDNMASPQPMPAEVVLNSGPNAPSYMPSFQAWVSNADDYEKQVAYNLLKALGSGANVTAPTKPRMTKRARHTNNFMQARYRAPQKPAGVRTSQTNWEVYDGGYNNPGLGVTGKSVDYMSPSANNKPKPPPTEPRHISSFFMNSQRPYKGSFIINPEWVSEGKSNQFMNTMQTRGSKAHGPPGMRC